MVGIGPGDLNGSRLVTRFRQEQRLRKIIAQKENGRRTLPEHNALDCRGITELIVRDKEIGFGLICVRMSHLRVRFLRDFLADRQHDGVPVRHDESRLVH